MIEVDAGLSKGDEAKGSLRELLAATNWLRKLNAQTSLTLLILVVMICGIPTTAYADWPVIQTKDEQTVLNLNTPENQIDLLECGMWVAKENGNYYLRNIKGKKIPVPKLAVKSIQDRSSLDIALDARLFGLKVRMMGISYAEGGVVKTWGGGTWYGERPPGRKSRYFNTQSVIFLIDGDRQKLTDAIHSNMTANPKLKDFTINYFPPEQKYGHLVIELLETKELTQGDGTPLWHWALLARGLSNTVNPPFIKVRFDGETGYIPMDSPYRRPAPHLQKKINATKPIRTQLDYACILGEDVPNAIPGN